MNLDCYFQHWSDYVSFAILFYFIWLGFFMSLKNILKFIEKCLRMSKKINIFAKNLSTKKKVRQKRNINNI